jgi:hypothetical protein
MASAKEGVYAVLNGWKTKNTYMVFAVAMHKACRRGNASARNLCTQGVWCASEHWRFEGNNIVESKSSD